MYFLYVYIKAFISLKYKTFHSLQWRRGWDAKKLMAVPDLKCKEFQVDGDPTTVSERWEEWIENLEFNCTFFKVTDAKNKKAALMIYDWQALRKIHNNLPDPENGNNYEKAKSKLTAYFAPKKNMDFLIYQRSGSR